MNKAIFLIFDVGEPVLQAARNVEVPSLETVTRENDSSVIRYARAVRCAVEQINPSLDVHLEYHPEIRHILANWRAHWRVVVTRDYTPRGYEVEI